VNENTAEFICLVQKYAFSIEKYKTEEDYWYQT